MLPDFPQRWLDASIPNNKRHGCKRHKASRLLNVAPVTEIRWHVVKSLQPKFIYWEREENDPSAVHESDKWNAL